MKQVFEKIKQRIIIAATEACGYAALTRVVSEAEVKEILDSVVTEYNNGWIPCSERLPEKTGYYLVQLSRKLPNEDYADRVVVLYNGEDKEFMAYERLIIAWQPLPEAYEPGKE